LTYNDLINNIGFVFLSKILRTNHRRFLRIVVTLEIVVETHEYAYGGIFSRVLCNRILSSETSNLPVCLLLRCKLCNIHLFLWNDYHSLVINHISIRLCVLELMHFAIVYWLSFGEQMISFVRILESWVIANKK